MALNPKGFLREAGRELLVGAEDTNVNYQGPVARVSIDKGWLWIITDDHEGAAMLNVEALPYLRRALSRLDREQRANKVHEKSNG